MIPPSTISLCNWRFKPFPCKVALSLSFSMCMYIYVCVYAYAYTYTLECLGNISLRTLLLNSNGLNSTTPNKLWSLGYILKSNFSSNSLCWVSSFGCWEHENGDSNIFYQTISYYDETIYQAPFGSFQIWLFFPWHKIDSHFKFPLHLANL